MDMNARRVLAEKVKADPELTAMEKETTINILGDEKEMRVFSAKPTIVKRLLKHSEFDLIKCQCHMRDGSLKNVDAESATLDVEDVEAVFNIVAHGSIALLTIKGVPRSNPRPSSVVNTPDDADRAEMVFGDDS